MNMLFAAAALAGGLVSGSASAAATCGRIAVDAPLAVTFSDPSVVSYDVDDGLVDEGLGSSALRDDIAFLFYDLGSGFHTGSIDLGTGDNANFATCAECVLIEQDIDGGTKTVDKYFFQSQGILTIDATTPPETDPIKLTWSNLRVIEVTLDQNTFVTTPVANGDCYDVVANRVFTNGFDGS